MVNPFALQLNFPDGRTRARRDFPKYLTLISSIALLHQHQRPVKTATSAAGTVEYIEATAEDVSVANRLASAVLGRSTDDLPPQTRRLLHQVQAWVQREASQQKCVPAAVRFSRRQLREALGVRNSQLSLHLARLVDFELLSVHRAARGAHQYGLEVADDAAAPVLQGLTDVSALGHGYDASVSGVGSQFPAPFRGASGAGAGRTASGNDSASSLKSAVSGLAARALPPLKNGAPVMSYVQVRR